MFADTKSPSLKVDPCRYSELVDNVVVGPTNISSTDINMVLGVNQELFSKSRKKRTDMIETGDKPSWLSKDTSKF